MLETIVGVAIGALLLYVFYSAVRTEWPVNYASTVNDFGLVINRDLLRYLLFALGPAYIVTLLIGELVERAGGSGIWTGALIAAVHVGRTLGVHIWKTVRSDTSPAKYPTVLLDCVVGVLVLVVGVLGGLGPGPYGFIVPDKQDFFSALWGTVLVVTIGIVAREKTRHSFDPDELVRRSKREVGATMLSIAEREAAGNACDPLILKTVLLTENLQRPRWFRRLERWKGRLPFFATGSYGVMQVQASSPIGDEESIQLGAELLRGAQVDRSSWEAKPQSLRVAFDRYNTNPYFRELAERIFAVLEYEELGDNAYLFGELPAPDPSAPGTPPVIPAQPTGRQDEGRIHARAQVLLPAAQSLTLLIASLGSLTDDQLRDLAQDMRPYIPRSSRSPST